MDAERKSLKFPKEERLHHRSLVNALFAEGKSFYEFPFRVSWRNITEEELQKHFRNNVPDGIGKMQVMITIPKKKRKKAVERVLMRRRIREAYRLNRINLRDKIAFDAEIRTLSISLIYIHDKNMSFQAVETKIKSALERLESKIWPVE